jgi:anti-sigma factor RsiW
MLQERLDEYLDGGLDPAGQRDVEALLASDATAARMLAQMRAQRALRAAAYDSYLPTKLEAKTLAERALSAAYDTPAGQVGYWVRRGAAVAAAVAVLVGTFAMGRTTASPRIVERVVTHTEYNYNVALLGADGGVQQVRDFSSLEKRNDFIQQIDQQGATGVAVAEVMAPGHL